MLNRPIILASGDIYLDMISMGSVLPIQAQTRIPLHPEEIARAYFLVGQMDPDTLDLNELFEIMLESFPLDDPRLALFIEMQVNEDKNLYTRVSYVVDHGHLDEDSAVIYGPYPVD